MNLKKYIANNIVLKLKRFKHFLGIIDYVFVPLVIFSLVFNAKIMHGIIACYETGKDVACVNGLFLGKILYKEIYTQYGPLYIFLEFLVMLFFGKSLVPLRYYFFFCTAATLIIGYLISRILCKQRSFAYAAAFILIVETFNPFWATRWGGIRYALPIAAILFAVLFIKKRGNVWLFIAGAFLSGAFFTSMEGGVFAFIAIVSTVFFLKIEDFYRNRSIVFKDMLFLLAGIAMILVPIVIYFLITSSLGEYINTVCITYKNHVSGWIQPAKEFNLKQIIREPLQVLNFRCKYFFVGGIYLVILGSLVLKKLQNKFFANEYCLWLIAVYGFLQYSIVFRGSLNMENPFLSIAMQPVIILGVVFLESVYIKAGQLKQGLESKNLILAKRVFLISFLVLSLGYVIFSKKQYYHSVKGWLHYQSNKNAEIANLYDYGKYKHVVLTLARAKGIAVPYPQAKQIEHIIRFLESETSPNEEIIVFPEDSIYLFLANRPCVGRFNTPGLAWTAEEYKEEFFDDLKKQKPTYIIYKRAQSVLAGSIGRKELFPEIRAYIKANYDGIRRFGDTLILKRKT